MLDWNDYLRVVTGLIAIIGPVSGIPLFLSFTANMPSRRRAVARHCGIAVAIILGVSVLLGNAILRTFSISIDGFRIAGGLLLMTIAFDLLQARNSPVKHTPEEDLEAMESDSVAVVPLAMPLLAGPGAISTMIVFGAQSPEVAHKAVLLAIAVFLGALVWICFHLAPRIAKRLSRTTMNVSMRVMGLILAAVAVEFIVAGLRALLPGLATA